jgi:GMP synthase (glutamine-hydrolysing)
LVRLLAVNNYPSNEGFIRLRECIEATGASVTVCDRGKCSALYFNSFDGVAVSGSPDMLSNLDVQEKYDREVEAIRDAHVPILGVCFGHQLLAMAFGSRIVKDAKPVLGFVKTEVMVDSPLFAGLPRDVMLLESRHEIVESLPSEFELLARSETSRVAAMKHTKRPLFGVQSHPERYTTTNPGGRKVVANFVDALQ